MTPNDFVSAYDRTTWSLKERVVKFLIEKFIPNKYVRSSK